MKPTRTRLAVLISVLGAGLSASHRACNTSQIGGVPSDMTFLQKPWRPLELLREVLPNPRVH